MEVIYRANDGTWFSDEDSCLEYEKKNRLDDFMEKVSPNTTFVDSDYHNIPINEFYEREDVIFGYYFPDDESAATIQQALEGLETWNDDWPDFKSGVYWWDTKLGTWIDLYKLKKDIVEKIDRICSTK